MIEEKKNIHVYDKKAGKIKEKKVYLEDYWRILLLMKI